MHQTATLYIRNTGEPYSRVDFKKGKPEVPQNYTGSFYIRTWKNGKRVWDSFKSLEAALTTQSDIATNIDRIRKGIAPLPTAEPEPILTPSAKGTIAAAVAEFITYSESRVESWRLGDESGLSPNSVVAYRKAAQDFAKACAEFGAVRMAEFEDTGEAILLNFKKWLQKNVTRKSGKGAYSDSRKFTVIGQLLARNGFKMKADRIFNPSDAGLMKRGDVPRVKKPGIGDVVFYTPDDIQAMLEAADKPDEKSSLLSDDLKDLLMLLLCGGMRDEEVQHLTWKDINWANGDGKMKITVQDKPQFDWRVKDHEKRIVCPDKNALLKKRLQDRQAGKGTRAPRVNSDLLFSTNRGNPDQNFADRINALQNRAEKSDYSFSRPEARQHILHNFRKSYATYQMLQGVPARNIQRDLGHSELSTTERYLAIVDEPKDTLKAYQAIK
jgi:integrase